MMKNFMLMLAMIIGLASCGGGSDNAAQVNNLAGDRVEVIYFHGKQRCATCMAIEENTRAVIDETFADEVSKGSVVFRIVDISTPEGEALADEYEVSWSSLFVNKWESGRETRNNMTEFGFAKARKNPEEFKQGLTEQINNGIDGLASDAA